jgi:hypothetical protein
MNSKFNIFGLNVIVENTADGWRTYYPGTDGKRRSADFVIPDFVEDADLEQYLGDLFHEDARPGCNQVVRL